MGRKILFIIMIITSIFTLASCKSKSNTNTDSSNSRPPVVSQPETGNDNTKSPITSPSNTDGENAKPSTDVTTPELPQQDSDPINEQINKMSLEQKIGQMIFAGVDGYTNNEHSASLINKYHVGGFILLGQNIENTQQVVNLLNSLKSTNANSGNEIPLFLGVDQEGGTIDRMPPGFMKIPTNRAIGGVDNSEFSYKVGTVLGEEVKAFGYNIDFAPVLDINSNPKNPVIGNRSFGPSYEVVTKLGIKTMQGIESQNIISVVKHFPGHGDTSVDSHTGLPVVNVDLNRLTSFELVPFAQAIKNGVDMVMAAHILFPKIDPNYPATMSKTILTNILRKDLGFNGVIITDDMTMGAITKNYDISKAAVRSVMAGSNIILVCHGYDNEVAVFNALKNAVESGQIPMDSIDNSVYKILKLKKKYNINDTTTRTVKVDDINNKIRSVLNSYMK